MSSDKSQNYSPDKSYKVGDLIQHEIYGIGTVINTGKTEGGNQRMTVKFNILGEMNLAMNFEALERAEDQA